MRLLPNSLRQKEAIGVRRTAAAVWSFWRVVNDVDQVDTVLTGANQQRLVRRKPQADLVLMIVVDGDDDAALGKP
jgi:hypothetical protein